MADQNNKPAVTGGTEAGNTGPAVADAKRKAKGSKRRTRKRAAKSAGKRGGGPVAFPKHAISKCLRIPQAILDQNAGKECTYREAAKFAGIGYTGDIAVEISSALKYRLLERVGTGTVKLSITHISHSQLIAEFDICESGHALPDDLIPRHRVARTCEVAPKLSELREVAGDGRDRGEIRRSFCQLVEDSDLELGERGFRWCFGMRPIDHGQPEDAPTENAERREQVDQAFGRAQL